MHDRPSINGGDYPAIHWRVLEFSQCIDIAFPEHFFPLSLCKSLPRGFCNIQCGSRETGNCFNWPASSCAQCCYSWMDVLVNFVSRCLIWCWIDQYTNFKWYQSNTRLRGRTSTN